MVYDLEKIRYQFDTVKPDFVIVSHASNVFGLIAPVEDIFALAKKYEAITLVDMAQTAGLVDLNVGLTTIDFAVFAGHKTLYGPFGIGGFINVSAVPLDTFIVGGTGSDSLNLEMPSGNETRYESSSSNIVAIAGLNAALECLNQKDYFDQEQEMTSYLVKQLDSVKKSKNVSPVKSRKTCWNCICYY